MTGDLDGILSRKGVRRAEVNRHSVVKVISVGAVDRSVGHFSVRNLTKTLARHGTENLVSDAQRIVAADSDECDTALAIGGADGGDGIK